MLPQEKRKRTIIERYGSYKKMLAKRDRRDLVLGGINGGRHRGDKGFAKWTEGSLSRFAKRRQRDSRGRFVTKEGSQPSIEDSEEHRQ